MRNDAMEEVQAKVLTATTYRAFRAAIGGDTPEWESLPEDSQNRWYRALVWFQQEEGSNDGRKVGDVTADLYGKYAGEDSGLPKFGELLPPYQIAWEAACRHAGMVLNDFPEELDDAENGWKAWADARLSKLTRG